MFITDLQLGTSVYYSYVFARSPAPYSIVEANLLGTSSFCWPIDRGDAAIVDCPTPQRNDAGQAIFSPALGGGTSGREHESPGTRARARIDNTHVVPWRSGEAHWPRYHSFLINAASSY